MTRYLSRLLALVLVAVIGLTGCSSATAMTGDYAKDTMAVVTSLRQAIELPNDAPDKTQAQAQARQNINDFISRYRRDASVAGLSSYMTMQTALNGLAGHYSSYPNRPLPEKLKKRLEKEFRQVELAVSRGA
jgi:photosystem II Psb27 protein